MNVREQMLAMLQVAAEGLAPQSQYRLYLAESNHAPFGKLESLAVLKTNPDRAGIVQSIGPLKTLMHKDSPAPAAPSQRFLIVTDINDSTQVIMRQSNAPPTR
jgi:hypothetical protein